MVVISAYSNGDDGIDMYDYDDYYDEGDESDDDMPERIDEPGRIANDLAHPIFDRDIANEDADELGRQNAIDTGDKRQGRSKKEHGKPSAPFVPSRLPERIEDITPEYLNRILQRLEDDMAKGKEYSDLLKNADSVDKIMHAVRRITGEIIPIQRVAIKAPVNKKRKAYVETVIKYVKGVKSFIRANTTHGQLQVNPRDARGTFAYTSIPHSKLQDVTANIKSMTDALYVSALLTRRDLLNVDALPPQYVKIFRLFQHANMNNAVVVHKFKKDLDKWLRPESRGRRVAEKQVKNPITNRWIKKQSATYKRLFKNIKLKSVIYAPLENFNTIDYDVDKYCVPSFLKTFLLKKEWGAICDDLEKVQTPTSDELTCMMNSIGYNLNVYIHDGECIQEQTEHKKKLNIMIHDDHMYVLGNRGIEKTIKDVKIVDVNEFDKIKSESYTESTKISGGTKYKLINKFTENDKEFGLRGTYTHANVNFFETCGIRPIRYIDGDIDGVQAIDINSCYQNIMFNDRYIFPIQDGTEITEAYCMKKDEIQRHGFYYVSINKKDDILCKLFGTHDCWMYGDVIISMKLLKHITIKYKNVCKMAKTAPKKPTDDVLKSKKLEHTFYTGYLAKYETTKTKTYECKGDEATAYMEKYENDGAYFVEGLCYHTYTENGKKRQKSTHYENEAERDELKKQYPDALFINPNVKYDQRFFLKSSGMYAYLSILQYARLQLYQIYCEIMKIDKNIKVSKIYTDSITFDNPLSSNIDMYVDKLNKMLKSKHGFMVKKELSTYAWEHNEIVADVPVIDDSKRTYHDDIIKLLDINKSFCINARAGYGKSHTIKNIIIPHLDAHGKKHILTSTTIEDAKKMGCDVINSLLATKTAHLDKIKNDFNDIDYLIIDEAGRLNMHLLNVLEYIKRHTNVKIIFAGDINQCDYDNIEIMDTYAFNKLCDHNVYTIQWHEKARYDKQYDDFLNSISTFSRGGHDPACIKLIKSFFGANVKSSKDKKDDSNGIKLTWTNGYGKQFDKNERMTVHKAQGKTIDETYSIYEIERMGRKVLYTALSRCTKPEYIHIYI